MTDHDVAYYQALIQQVTTDLMPVFTQASIGDFSAQVPFPEHESELTNIYVGVKIMQDVVNEKLTQLEQVNRNLAQRYQEQSALLQSIGDGVVAIDQAGLIIFINPAAERMLGWTSAEVIGKRWVEIIPMLQENGTPIPAEERLAYPDKVMETMVNSLTRYYVTRTGKKLPVMITVAPVSLNTQPMGKIIAFHDITREKEVEQLKTEFLSVAAHELRSPLSAIRWNLESLLSHLRQDLPPDVKQKLASIYNDNLHMITLVNNILSISRISSGLLVHEQRPANIVKVIQTILNRLEPASKEKHLHLTFNYQPQELQTQPVIMDANQFSQIFENILNNAIKYNKVEGKVDVEVVFQPNELCVTVKDTGIGIPPEDLSQIFERYYRGYNAQEAGLPGSGLGLYIAKALIRALGGTISLESQLNQGTTVKFCLPVSLANQGGV